MAAIRKMEQKDRETVFHIMREFYNSEAVEQTSPDAVLYRDIDDCIGGHPLLDGFVFEADGRIVGYAMTAKSYSTEYGGMCVWIEDICLTEGHRHQGIGEEFFAFVEREYPQAVRFRLEVEPENEHAVAAYEKFGYRTLPYFSMTKEREI